MKDFKESLWLFVMQMGIIAVIAIAVAITAIAQALPWIILVAAIGVCLISVTVTGCVVWAKSRRQPPPIYIIQSGQLPRLPGQDEALSVEARKPAIMIENPKAHKRIGAEKR